MVHRSGKGFAACFVLFLLACPGLTAETAPSTTEEALHAASRLAGVIFAGRVASITETPGANGGPGYVQVEFSIEDGVRGVSGRSYVLRQWEAVYQRFQVGRRYLVLLHAPGPSGLSAPVGGADGAIPVTGESVSSAVASVDLSWIAAQSARPVAYPARPITSGTARPSPATARMAKPVLAVSSDEAADPTPGVHTGSHLASYTTVLTLLRTWEEEDARSR